MDAHELPRAQIALRRTSPLSRVMFIHPFGVLRDDDGSVDVRGSRGSIPDASQGDIRTTEEERRRYRVRRVQTIRIRLGTVRR